MKEAIKKEIILVLAQTINVLSKGDIDEAEELKKISDQAVEHVALHKDLDLISVTVLVYSVYKVIQSMRAEDFQELLQQLTAAKTALQNLNFGVYNRSIRRCYEIVKSSNAEVKLHLQDIMQAARIKKGTALLERGLSIGQAAGLMGLSNWDLQQYAGKTTALEPDRQAVPAVKRLQLAYKLFGI